jgi:hypothetical protein
MNIWYKRHIRFIEGIEGCEYFVRMLSDLFFGALYPSTELGMLGLLIDQGVPTRMWFGFVGLCSRWGISLISLVSWDWGTDVVGERMWRISLWRRSTFAMSQQRRERNNTTVADTWNWDDRVRSALLRLIKDLLGCNGIYRHACWHVWHQSRLILWGWETFRVPSHT